MRDYTRWFSRLTPGSVLALILLGSPAAAQSNSLSGSYGFLLNQYVADSSSTNVVAILGVMNFDGAGNVTGSFTLTSPNQVVTGALTGTYSTPPDGVGVKPGNVTLAFDLGATVSLAMVVTDGGQGLQLVATDCSGVCDLAGKFINGTARAAYAGSLQGVYGFQLNTIPVPSGFLGVVSFDGSGNATMSVTNVGVPREGSPPRVGGGTAGGTYSLNPDGSGTITLVDASGNPNLTFAIVGTDGGSGLMLVLTGGPAPGGTVSSGSGRVQ